MLDADLASSILMDGRLGWHIIQGKVIFSCNMTKEEAKHWKKLPWPHSKEFLEKAEAMQDKVATITSNFTWEPPRSSGVPNFR